MYRYCLYIILVIIISSCSSIEKDKKAANIVQVDPTKVQNLEFSDLFQNLDYVFLKTEGEVLGFISKLEVVDEKIIVADRQNNALYIFDLFGKLINKIYRYGKGEGEYIKISDFCYDSKNNLILILDRNQGKVIKYHTNGTLAGEIRLPDGFYSKIYMIDQSNFAIYASNERLSEYNYKIIDSQTGNVLKNMMKIDLIKSRFLNFLTHSNFYRYSDEVFTYQIADDGKVYSIQEDTIAAKYQIRFGEYSIPHEVLNTEFGDVGEFVDFVQDKYVYRISNLFETSNYILFGFHFLDQYLQCIYDKTDNKFLLLSEIIDNISTDIKISEKWAFSNNSFKGVYNNEVYGFFWTDAMIFNSESKMIDGQHITEKTNPVVYIGGLKDNLFDKL